MSTPYDPNDPQHGQQAPQQGGERSGAEPADPYARPAGSPGQHQASPAASTTSGPPPASDGSAYSGGPAYSGAPVYSGAPAYSGPPAYTGGQQGYGGQPYATMPYGDAGYGYAGRNPTEANGLGIWSLCLGIASFVLSLGFLTGIPAIILGHKSRRAAAEGRATNGGMGLAGIIMGWVAVVGSILLVIVLVVVFSNPEFRTAFEESYSY